MANRIHVDKEHQAYWRTNITIVCVLLVIWAIVGYVLPIFAVEALNDIRIGGFGLGFWIAQQGSIVAFILLVLVYCISMNRLDKKYGVSEDESQ
jgi:putative solute:sodium symporter small subunit